jgi:hypothetical protein
MHYKHHVIPLHEWRKRINSKATRYDREFNAPDNVVWLTLEQHIECHKRLAEDGSKWDRISYLRMTGQIGHEEATIQAIKLANIGRKQSIEQRHKKSEQMKGKRYGLGWNPPESFRIRQSEIHKGVPRSQEFCETQSRQRRGVPVRKIECPHCSKVGGCSNMIRYHFKNCKEKYGKF